MAYHAILQNFCLACINYFAFGIVEIIYTGFCWKFIELASWKIGR
jgi:hypothetical protein